jgi:peptidoglycan/LPS O-acetylase OafA/YrhL
MVMVGPNIVVYFPIWLLGLLVSQLPQIPAVSRRPTAALVATTTLVAVILGLSHWTAFKEAIGNSLVAGDYLTACSFACLLYVLLHCRQPSATGLYAALSRWLANFSYTLYVVHLPLLVFLRACLIPDRPWLPDLPHIGLALLIGIGTIAYAWCLARLTEANTDSVRDFFLRAPKTKIAVQTPTNADAGCRE